MDGQKQMREWFDSLNGGKVARHLLADGFVYRGGDREFTAEELRARVAEYRNAFPELLFSVDFVVTHGEKVGVAWTAVTRTKSARGVGTATLRNGKFVQFDGVMPNL